MAPAIVSSRPVLRAFPCALPRAPRSPRRLFVRGLLSALLSVALLLGMASLATPAQAHARTDAERLFANAVLRLMNYERVINNLPPLTADWRLRSSARAHNAMMARYNTLSHQLPGEPNFAQRITNAGYPWTYAGENVAYNTLLTQTGAVTLEALMYNERPPNDGHRLNILNSHYRNVGVDVWVDLTHHKIWLTTDFGHT
jgi:uncharacterized protein YkwD